MTNTAFTSYPVSQFTFPNGRLIDNTYDLLYRRTSVVEAAARRPSPPGSSSGPSRVAEVALGQRPDLHLDEQRPHEQRRAVADPPVQSAPGATSRATAWATTARAARSPSATWPAASTARRTLQHATAVVGFTTAFDRASNKFYERALHAENRSHLYEPFDSKVPQGGYDSLDRLLQYQRGTLDSTGGSGGNGGGDR